MKHAEQIETVITTCQSKTTKLPGRLLSVGSDGESRRGAALNQLTLKHALSKDSPIYPLLSPIPIMNLLTGDDEVTAAKDPKHIFKRARTLIIREKGVSVYGFKLTPAIVKYHLHMSGHSPETIAAWMKPKDAQDVPTALSLLCAIWELPLLPREANPTAYDARRALRTLGRLFYYLVMPFIDVALSLRTQLEYLSALMHLMMDLYISNPTGGSFLPNPLFSDIAIMIKDVYFCVAKTMISDPNSEFHIILLGTDRLESSFGVLRTITGNNSNVDMLQMSTRLSHTTECANILARHPEWDRSPRRLRLPTLEGLKRASHEVDHVNVASWKGDVSLKDIVLLTCWNAGAELAAQNDAAMKRRIEGWASDDSINILAPLGVLMAKLDGTAEDDDTLDDDPALRVEADTALSQLPDVLMGLEDAVGAADSTDSSVKHSPFITIKDKKIHKATALNVLFKHLAHEGSTDRTRRVAGLAKYAVSSSFVMESGNGDDSADRLEVQDPGVILVRCDGRITLAVVMISGIKRGSIAVPSIPYSILSEDDVSVTGQILHMTPDEIRNGDEVWLWNREYESQVLSLPGRQVHPVDPTLVTREALEPTYEFMKSELQGFSASLFTKMDVDILGDLSTVKATDSFPYRTRG